MMISNYLRKRRLGLLDNPQQEQWKILDDFISRKKIVQSQQYTVGFEGHHEYERECRLILAVDSSGQNVLIGGSAYESNEPSSIKSIHIGSSSRDSSNLTMKYDEETWKQDGRSTKQIIRLQFMPNGDQTYLATYKAGLRLVDVNSNSVFFNYNSEPTHEMPQPSHHWSDWHPQNVNLIADCSRSGTCLVDTRLKQQAMKVRIKRFKIGCCRVSDSRCCLWCPRNDNHLIVSEEDDGMVMYDVRKLYHKIGRIFKPGMKCEVMTELQITPNKRHLLAWSEAEHELVQWEYPSRDNYYHHYRHARKTWLVRKLHKYWPLCGNVSTTIQYYSTDSHVFVPRKAEHWLPVDEDRQTVDVFPIDSGCPINGLDSMSKEYHPQYESVELPRVDNIVGVPSRPELLYTLNNRCQLGVWSFSSNPQDETGTYFLNLNRGKMIV